MKTNDTTAFLVLEQQELEQAHGGANSDNNPVQDDDSEFRDVKLPGDNGSNPIELH